MEMSRWFMMKEKSLASDNGGGKVESSTQDMDDGSVVDMESKIWELSSCVMMSRSDVIRILTSEARQ